MTTVPARRTTTLLAALSAVVLPMGLTACGVGLDPQTYRERTTQDATNANVGDLALRDVAVQPPASGQSELSVGSDALATLTIVSGSQQADTLTAVSTPAAASAELVDANGQVVQSVDIPALGSVAPTQFGIALRGLTAALRPGTYIELTLSFTNNGRADIKVPVKVYDSPLPRDSFPPKPAAE